MNRKKVKFTDELKEIHIDHITEDTPIEIWHKDKIVGYACYDGKRYHAITDMGTWTGRDDFIQIKNGLCRKYGSECEFILLDS